MLKKMPVVLLSLAMLLVLGSVAFGQALADPRQVDFTVNVSSHVALTINNANITINANEWELKDRNTDFPYLYATASAGDGSGNPHLEILANRNWKLTLQVQDTDRFLQDGGELIVSLNGVTGNSSSFEPVTFRGSDLRKDLPPVSGSDAKGKKKYTATYELKAPLEKIEGNRPYKITLIYTIVQ